MYDYVLSTNARDEPNISEFVVHHLMLGFDHVFVVDHKSKTPIQHEVDKLPDIFKSNITVVRHDTDDGRKSDWINKYVVPFALKNCSKYFVHLDADEYIKLRADIANIQELFEATGKPDILLLHWRMFGTSGLLTNPNCHLMPAYTKCDNLLAQACKSFIHRRVFSKKGFSYNHPHWLSNFKATYTNLTGKSVELVHPDKNFFKTFADTRSPETVEAYINHYAIQSVDCYIKRKIKRVRDDNLKFRTKTLDIDVENILALHDETECLSLKTLYHDKLERILCAGVTATT